MKTTAVACNHCGAPLTVAASTRFVTCKHCDSQLEVRQDASAAWTEVVEKIGEVEAHLDERLLRIEAQGELDALDRSWERTADRFRQFSATPNRGGDPSPRSGVVWLRALSAGCLVLAVVGLSAAAPVVAVIGGACAVVCLAASQIWAVQASRYGELRRDYVAQRREILSRLRRP